MEFILTMDRLGHKLCSLILMSYQELMLMVFLYIQQKIL